MRSPIFILALVVVVTGCSSGTPPEGIRIEGIEWRAVSVADMVPAAINAPTLRIVGDQITGSSGCNGYSGKVRFADGRLVTDQVQGTLRAFLEDRANEIERRFLAILGSRPAIGTRSGRLVLVSPEGEIVLESRGIDAGPTT